MPIAVRLVVPTKVVCAASFPHRPPAPPSLTRFPTSGSALSSPCMNARASIPADGEVTSASAPTSPREVETRRDEEEAQLEEEEEGRNEDKTQEENEKEEMNEEENAEAEKDDAEEGRYATEEEADAAT